MVSATAEIYILWRVLFHTATLRAYKPIGKAQSEQFHPASVLAIVTVAKFLEGNRCCVCHDDVPLLFWNIILYHLPDNMDHILKLLWLAE